jgi:nucleotide-binding universal stress UspA family protein
MPKVETILVAIDGSPASAAASEQAIDLAASLGSRLLVVYVVNAPDVPAGAVIRPTMAGVREEAEAVSRKVVEQARRLGVEATYLTWEGQPGEAIVAAAEAESADMIVAGSHGRSAVGRLLLGSVSEYLVRHAPVPVLVVHPTEAHVPVGAAGT